MDQVWIRYELGMDQVWNRYALGMDQVWNRYALGMEEKNCQVFDMISIDKQIDVQIDGRINK